MLYLFALIIIYIIFCYVSRLFNFSESIQFTVFIIIFLLICINIKKHLVIETYPIQRIDVLENNKLNFKMLVSLPNKNVIYNDYPDYTKDLSYFKIVKLYNIKINEICKLNQDDYVKFIKEYPRQKENNNTTYIPVFLPIINN